MAHPKKESALVKTLNSDDRKTKPKVKATPKVTVETQESKQARAGAAAVLKTLNSDDRKKPKVKATPKKRKVPESADSKQARAGAAAVLKTLNSDDRNRHHKSR